MEQMKAMRNKYWNECDQDEKIDRLRAEVINLSAVVIKLAEISDRMMAHSHRSDGLPVAPIVSNDTFERRSNGIPHSLREGEK